MKQNSKQIYVEIEQTEKFYHYLFKVPKNEIKFNTYLMKTIKPPFSTPYKKQTVVREDSLIQTAVKARMDEILNAKGKEKI